MTRWAGFRQTLLPASIKAAERERVAMPKKKPDHF
jgi:hypothetical protein